MYAYIKDRVVVNVIEQIDEPAASCVDFVLQRDDLQIGDLCEGPYLIRNQIEALEAKQPRAIREAILSGDKTRVQALEDQISALRALI